MNETLYAQFDFPILKSEAQIQQERDEALEEIIPYYRLNQSVFSDVEKTLNDMQMGDFSYLKGGLAAYLNRIYDRGIISLNTGDVSNSGSHSDLVYVQRFRRAERVPVSEIYTRQTAIQQLKTYLRSIKGEFDPDSLFNSLDMSVLIVPNLMFDKETTELVHDDAVDDISTTSGVVKAGQVIISNGEIVTAEVEQLLESYENEFNKSVGYYGSSIYQWISSVLIALSLVVVLFLAIYYCNSRIFEESNKYLYLLMVFTLSAVAATLMSNLSAAYYYMVPFTLVSLYLLAFFKQRVVFTVYVISLLPLLLCASNGLEVFFIYLVAGVVGMLVFEYFNRGWLQFVTAFIVFLVMGSVWLAFRLAEGVDSLSEYYVVVYMAFGALLSVAGYPLIYLFEKIFKLVSKSKLVDLCDTGNPLLRKLAEKAPGTFQHSLQVMNLADAVARSIDADVALVRAGALYHDVGKIENPICFTENETPGIDYHANLSCKESAMEITAHVDNGMALAEKYGLPTIIKDFIRTHHGTSCTGYFYNKYLNEGGDPAATAEFFYDGVKPVTKEQVILMLCDGVEAASRSLKDHSAETISALVEKIVGGKIEDGQLSEAEISLSELNTVKEVMKNYIQQMYHVRVAYPKRVAKA
jgi:putative nucleotidyltransferase with HDIG domain